MTNTAHQPSILSNMKIGLKVWLPVIVFILAFIGIGVFTLSSTYDTMVDDRKDKVRSVVEAATSIVKNLKEAAEKGEMSVDEAKHAALETLRAMRYNKVEYLFVIDMDAHVMMHPIKPALEGKDLSGFKDPEGTPLFINLAAASKAGGGFVPYMWPLPHAQEGDPPASKISYISHIPDWNWGIGSGLYMVDVYDAFQNELIEYVISAVVALVLAGALSYFVSRNVTFGLHRLSGEMSELANGSFDISISGVKRKDEVGVMARSVKIFQDHAIRARDLEQANEQQKLEAEAEKKRLMQKMADDFESSVAEIVKKAHEGAMHIIATAQNMSRRIDQGSSRTIDVAEASNRTRSNVQTVAASAEELSSSVSEINRQVGLGSQLAATAASEAEQTNTKVQGLSDAAQKIGEVVGLINDIADQTNLLALNATIEAARAGEAGKGFAVVASEVKNLANQTAKATEEIGVQITDMQSATTDSVNAIHGFGKIISEINESTSATAHSVEQQGLATQEIAQNTREVSEDVNLVSDAVGDVSRASAQSYSSSIKVLWAGQDLEKVTSEMDSVVKAFLGNVRA